MIVRLTGLAASVAASIWQIGSGSVYGGAFFGVLALFSLVSLLPGRGRIARRWDGWFATPKVAARAKMGAPALVALVLGVTQLTGWGLGRDVGRGILGLLGALVLLAIAIDVMFFADRRRAKQRFEHEGQEAWLQRIAPPEQIPPRSR